MVQHADIDHTGLTGISSGSVATDSIWDAAGDLAVGSGANTAAKLAIGATNGMALMRVSGAVAWALPPGTEVDYVEFTSQVTITATSEGASAAVVSGTSKAYAAGDYWVEFFCPFVQNGNFTTFAMTLLYDGSTVLGRIGRTQASANGEGHPMLVRRKLTLSAATHQLIIKSYIDAGTQANYIGGAGGSAAQVPGYIRVTTA